MPLLSASRGRRVVNQDIVPADVDKAQSHSMFKEEHTRPATCLVDIPISMLPLEAKVGQIA